MVHILQKLDWNGLSSKNSEYLEEQLKSSEYSAKLRKLTKNCFL